MSEVALEVGTAQDIENPVALADPESGSGMAAIEVDTQPGKRKLDDTEDHGEEPTKKKLAVENGPSLDVDTNGGNDGDGSVEPEVVEPEPEHHPIEQNAALSDYQATDAALEVVPVLDEAAPGTEPSAPESVGIADAVPGAQDSDMVPGTDEVPPGTGEQSAEEHPDGHVVGYVDCPHDSLKRLIGKKGITIKTLEMTTGARIQIEHEDTGDTKRVRLTGTPEAVERATRDIQTTLSSGDNPGDVSKTVDCPPGIVGRVIGRGGETIRQLQTASGARIAVDQSVPEGEPKKVNITGKQDDVDRATLMVIELINSGPEGLQAVISKYGTGITRKVTCTKSLVGKIIGKGGETIKHIQKSSGADSIQIDQKREPCEVTVVGQQQTVDKACAMLREIINGGPGFAQPSRGPSYAPQYPSHGYSAPGPGYGGYNMPPAPMPGYGYYGQGYSPYPPMAAPYGAYGGYGGSSDPYGAAGYGSSGGGGGGGYSAQAASTPPSTTNNRPSSVWQELHDDQGRPYYYNTTTGVSQWEKPAGMP